MLRTQNSSLLSMKIGYNKPFNPQSNILKNKNMFLVTETQGSEKLGTTYYFYKFTSFSQH